MRLAYCGLNCKECEIYLASVSGDAEKQIQLAEAYSTDTCRFLEADMFCLGCHSDTLSEKMCGDCEIRNRGMENICR